MEPRLAAPPPGLYPDVPARAYHAWNAVSNSMLTVMHDRSPAHMLHELAHPSSPTEARLVGHALHTLVLQPEEFDKLYAVAPRVDRRTKAGKAAWANFLVTAAGRIPLPRRDFDRCVAMRDAIRGHPAARSLLDARGPVELSAVFDLDGLRCKARVDKLLPPGVLVELRGGAAVDLKTTPDASPAAFARSVHHWGYDRQAGHYLDGLAELGHAVEHFVFVAVEKEPPHATAVYVLDEVAIAVGREQLRMLYGRYWQCRASGDWSAYGTGMRALSLPDWALGGRQVPSINDGPADDEPIPEPF